MYPTTAGFQTKALESHTACFKVDVLVDGQTVDTIENTADDVDPEGGIVGGSIQCDSTAQVWRSGHVQIADRTGALLPLVASDNLQPLGNELRIWRGIVIDGTPEYVPLITGPMFNVSIEDTGGYLLDIDVYDRSRSLSAYRYAGEYPLTSGTNVGTALLALLADRFPAAIYASMTTSFVSTTSTTPLAVLGGTGANDPGNDAVALAASAGLIFYFDRLGNPVLAPMPDPAIQSPAWTIAEGSNLITVKKTLTAEGTFNGVIVTSSATGGPYTATVWDTDTTSPTYYLGKFGKRPEIVAENLVNSTADATALAASRLIAHQGAVEEVGFATPVNPALDPLDVVLVQRERLGIDARYILSQFPIPLDVTTSMRAVCRVRNG